MKAFQALLDTALVGTGRQQPVAPAIEGAVGDLLRRIDRPPAQRLLAMAGVLNLCRQAGYQGAPAAALPAAAEAEALPFADAQLAETVLEPVLAEGPDRLQHEAFTRLAAAALLLPPAQLPAALDAGRRSTALRVPLSEVMGRRGRWLAALNPSWKFALGADQEAPLEELWDHGSTEQRHAAFIRMRQRDPAAARDKLAAELPQLGARERADFLPLLGPELEPGDESLLDPLLKDRGKEVRMLAGLLLARFPGSRHAQAVVALLAPLVKRERGLLGSHLAVDAPAAADPKWKDEGIDIDRPRHESLGERAWWLYQLARQAPLPWWTAHTGMAPADLYKSAGKGDWSEALRRAWRDATMASGDAAWATVLLRDWDEKALGHDPSDLLAILPLREREEHWQAMLAGNRAQLAALADQLLRACPPGHRLSPGFSSSLARTLAPAWADDYGLRHNLPDLLCLLDPAVLEVVANGGKPADDTPAAGEFRQRLHRIAKARQALARLPSNATRATP